MSRERQWRRLPNKRHSPRPTVFKPLITIGQMTALDNYFQQVLTNEDTIRASGRLIINKVFKDCTQYQTRIALEIYADIARSWCHVEKHSNAFTYYFSAYKDDQPHDPYIFIYPEDIKVINDFIASHLRDEPMQIDAYALDYYNIKLQTSKRNLWILLWLVLSLHEDITVTRKSYRKQEETKQQVISYTIVYNNGIK
jgi:hypothetical protein